jgi:RHS repeat-associated protein
VAHSKVSGAWTYDQNNRLLQSGVGAGATSYAYDNAGNLTEMTQPGARVTRYGYDTQNRLSEVRDGAGRLVARYGYSPSDLRIWKEQFRDGTGAALSQPSRTLYLYNDDGLLAHAVQTLSVAADGETVTSAGAPTIDTQYGLRPDSDFSTGVLFLKTRNSAGQDVVAYYHHDQLGTPIQATDKSGAVVWSANYNVFGRATITTPAASPDKPTITSILRLPGQFEDEETGFHYNVRRYYDPATGRYVTQDPLGLEGGNNGYVYSGSDPVNRADPTGECPMCVAFALCMAECMLTDVAINAVTGECNNFGSSAKNCAIGCAVGMGVGWAVGKVWKWAKKAASACELNSFSPDTPVHVRPEGAASEAAKKGRAVLKRIADLKVGDEVLAFADWIDDQPKPGADPRLSYQKVTEVYTSNRLQTVVYIGLGNGEELVATEGHPFNTRQGWRDAVLLQVGDVLLSKGAGLSAFAEGIPVTSIRTEQSVLPAFNLQVANAHTFFVGQEGALAHNCGRGKGLEFTRKIREDTFNANKNCVYCGKETIRSKTPHPDRYNADHTTSVKDGGTGAASNAQTTCQTCNLDKGGLSDPAYRAKKGLP